MIINNFLGDTLEKIAKEKAGIIKAGVPVVIGESLDETRHVFIEKAKEESSEILFADDEFKAVTDKKTDAGISKLILDILRNNEIFLSGLESPLAGNYQKKNIVTVCAAASMLAPGLCRVSASDIGKESSML